MRCLHCRRGEVVPKDACRECGVSQVPLMVDMLAPGTLLHDGTYEVGHPIGRGGFGITYEATHRNLEAPVAIKEYFPSGAARAGAAGRVVPSSDTRAAHERHLKRFVAQGRVLARLSHPNVVRVQDLFQERDTAYLVMERLGGASLSEHLELRPDRLLPASEVIELGAQLTEALEAIHSQGIYHLDVKPDNLRLLPSGRLVLLDVGALRTAERGRTSTQAFTAEYAPPELLAGDEVGPESDLYELAVLLVELLTAQRPRPALERMLSHRHDLPEGLEPAWREHLRQALALRRADRPPRVGAWWRELMQAVQGGRRPAELGTSASTARPQSDEHRPTLAVGSARAVLPAPQRGAAPGARDARVLRAGGCRRPPVSTEKGAKPNLGMFQRVP